MVHGLEEKWGQHVDFVFLNIEDGQTTRFKQQLGYQYQPHIFVLDGDGNIVQQWVGLVPGETIQAVLPDVINQ